MRSIVRLLLLCVFALVWTSGVPVGAAAPFGWARPNGLPSARDHRLPLPESALFDADRSLLPALLSQPLAIHSTARVMAVNPAVPPPRLNNLIISNISGTQATARYSSDVPSSTLIYVSSPLTEFSSPGLTTDHSQVFSNLAPGTGYRLRALAVSADLGLGALPDVVFTTAIPAQPGGVAQVVAGVADLVNDPDDPNALFAVISFRNVGTGDAADVSLTALNVSPGWAFTNPLPLPLDLGALGRGASGIILTRLTFNGTPPATAPLLTGTGTVTMAGGNPQPFNLGGTVPVLFVTKTVDHASAHPGDIVTFTVTATNRGLGAATSLLLGDVLPAGLTFVDAASGGQLQNGVVVWSPGGLAPGATGSVTFRAQVAANTPPGTTISNIAQARSAEIPNPVAGGPSVITVTALPQPQLLVTKSADRSSAQPNDLITYTIAVSNTGSLPATNVRLVDVVPAGTAYIDSVNGLQQGGTLTWNLGTLAPGTSTSVNFRAQVLSSAVNAGSVNNSAQATSAEIPNPVTSNNVAVTVTSPPPPPPQLQLTKSADRSTAQVGQSIRYSITVSNVGGGPATNVQIFDAIPGGTSFLGADSNGGPINATTLGWTLSLLAAGSSATVSFQVQVTGNNGPITNVAQARSTEVPVLVSSNGGNPVVVQVLSPPPSLTVFKEVDVTSTQPGGPVNFRLTVTNNGAGQATGVTLTDTLPAGLSGLAALDGGFLSFGTATWNLGTLTPGATRQVRLQAQANNNPVGTITNVAQVRSVETPSPVGSNPVSVTVTQPPPPINLTIQKVLSPAAPTAAPGDTLRYVISFQNNGGATVSGAAIVDQVPTNLQVVATSQGVVPVNGVLTWNLGPMGPGQGGSVAFQAVINPNTPNQTPINNQAQITVASQGYAQQSNFVTTVVNVPPPSLSLTKQVDKSTALAGDTLTYTLTYANTGGQTANPAVILDQLPAGVTFGGTQNNGQLVSANPPNTGLFVRFTLGAVPPGTSGSVQFTVQINPNAAPGSPITNQAAINAPGLPQPVVSNPVTTTVASAPPPPINLTIQKVLSPAAPTAAPGDTLFYVIAFQNNGTGTVSGAAIADPIPANTQFKVASQGVTPVNGVLTWSLPPLAPGQGGSVAFQAMVNSNAPNQTPISNQAQITVAAQGYIQQSNVVTTIVTVAQPPSLTLSKQVDKSTAAPGDTLIYTLNFANTGSQTANPAVILDQLPSGVTFGGASNNGQLVNATPPSTGLFVRFTLGALAPGASGSVQFTVHVNNVPSGTPITNQAAINAPGLAQPVVSNPVTTTVASTPPPPLNLSIQKVLNPAAPTAAPGDTLYYVIAFQNNGSTTVSGAAIVDTIPTNTQFKTASQGVMPVNGVLTWNLGPLGPGQGSSVAFQAVVNSNTPNQTPITNQAQITVAAQGYAQQSNVVTTIVTVAQPASLTLTKQVDKSVAGVGDTLTYTLNYANTGSQTAHQVVLADSLTGGLIFIPGSNGAQVNGGTVSFALGDVGPGGSGSISFQVQISNNLPVGTVVPNQARLTSPDLPQPITSNQVTTTVGPAATSFTGTWFAISNGPSVSLTVDPQNEFTVWAVSQDRQTVARAAQGHLNPDGSFDVFSSDQLVHFTGKVAADRQMAAITAARSGFVPFTVTAQRAPDVVPNPLPTPFVGTFNGSAVANDGTQLQVVISIDPGGNATFEDAAVLAGSTSVRLQFAHFYVTPSGQLIDPNGNIQIGMLQVQNNTLVLTYNFQSAGPPAYQNTFQVQLQPLP